MDNKVEIVGNGKSEIIKNALEKQTETIQIDKDTISEVKIKNLNPEEMKKETLKKYKESMDKVILPNIGTEFSIAGQIFKVTYINKGKKRISAEPMV